MDKKTADKCRTNAQKLSKKALWCEFIQAYKTAYDIALKNRDIRLRKENVTTKYIPDIAIDGFRL